MISKHLHDNVDDQQSNQPSQPPEAQKVDFTQFFKNNAQQQQPQTGSVATNPPTATQIQNNNNDNHMMHVGISHSNGDDNNNSSSDGDQVSVMLCASMVTASEGFSV